MELYPNVAEFCVALLKTHALAVFVVQYSVGNRKQHVHVGNVSADKGQLTVCCYSSWPPVLLTLSVIVIAIVFGFPCHIPPCSAALFLERTFPLLKGDLLP